MKRKPFKLILAAIASVALLSCGGNQNKQEDPKDVAEEQNEAKFDDSNKEKDTEFAVAAADGGLFEVESSQLALQKAKSPEVKKLAQMMVTDHTKANEELKGLAQVKGISLPAAVGEDHRDKIQKLQEKTGADFDKEYIDLMVKAHEKDVKAFEKQAEDGNDAELKSWAAGKVTTLRHHLEMTKAAEEVVKKTK